MSYVIAAPEMMTAAATDLVTIGSSSLLNELLAVVCEVLIKLSNLLFMLEMLLLIPNRIG